MKYGCRRFLLLVLGLLAGCAGAPPPIDKHASPERIANDIGLPSVVPGTLFRCNMADTTPGEKLAIFRPCLYVQLADGAALVGYDEAQQKYRVLHRLDARAVRAVAMKEMGRAKQIQLHTEQGFTVFDLLSDDRVWGNPSASRAAYDHLRSLGIAATEPVRMVANYHPIRVEAHSY
jgi:hypothetical protein